MSTFLLKIIAMATMFCDHLSYVLYGLGKVTFLNCIGRLAMFIFSFQLVLGYKNTKNLKQYLFRLLVIAFISQGPYYLLFYSVGLGKRINVDFTLFLGLLSIVILNLHKDKNGKIIASDKDYSFFQVHSIRDIVILFGKCFFIFFICHEINFVKNTWGYVLDYTYVGVLLILFLYLFYPFTEKFNIKRLFLYVAGILIFSFLEAQMWFGMEGFVLPEFYDIQRLMDYLKIYIFCIVGGLFLLTYNGRKGRNIKWFTYLFYPFHLILLYFLYLLVYR